MGRTAPSSRFCGQKLKAAGGDVAEELSQTPGVQNPEAGLVILLGGTRHSQTSPKGRGGVTSPAALWVGRPCWKRRVGEERADARDKTLRLALSIGLVAASAARGKTAKAHCLLGNGAPRWR